MRVQGVRATSEVSVEIHALITHVNAIDFIKKTTSVELKSGRINRFFIVIRIK